METSYCVEYSKSNRATCKNCQLKIDKGPLRLGYVVPGKGEWDDTSWSHLECHQFPLEVSEEETLTAASQIERYSELEPTQQAEVDKWYAKASKGTKKVAEPKVEEEAARPAWGTDLEVPFKQKDQVSELGAKWDQRANVWTVPFGTDLVPFTQWLGQSDSPSEVAAEEGSPVASQSARPHNKEDPFRARCILSLFAS